KMYQYLNTQNFAHVGKASFAVPSYDSSDPDYSPKQYWRGPIWINLNWLLFHGLTRYGYHQYAGFIKRSIIELCKRSGFHEYYDPRKGQGYGSDKFSWTAALMIDVLMSDAKYALDNYEQA
ncbi:MAG TPA: hypothetical protein VK106_04770, partial [Balneolaceae bacterium]|nr:hypothetical protein [Balneolaceae bacterium]